MNNINPALSDGDQQPNVTPNQVPDANKQYQDILDKYAQEIKKTIPEEAPENINIPEAIEAQEPVLAINTAAPSMLSQNIEVDENENEAEIEKPYMAPPIEPIPTPPPIEEPVAPQITNPEPPPIITPDFPPVSDFVPPVSISSPKSGLIPKIAFFISLSIFVGVAGALAYTFITGNPINNLSKSNIQTTSAPTTANQNIAAGCDLNDTHYKNGQSFVASDGCNSCTCTAGDITCTSKTCLATSSAKTIKPTEAASSSSTATLSAKTTTPTKSATSSSTVGK